MQDTHPLFEPVWKCDNCGGLLELDFEAVFDLKKIRSRKPNLWRYREALPVMRDENIVSFGEGFTPLVPVRFGERTVLGKAGPALSDRFL